jgi:hypothetical protein
MPRITREILAAAVIVAVLLASRSLAADAPASAAAVRALKAELGSDQAPGPELATKSFGAVALTKADAAAARSLLVKAYTAQIAKTRTTEIKDRVLKDDKLEMPFTIKEFGKKPAAGWSMWISMHGGGGAPKQVNDQQWENQKRLYTLDEGLYVTPRAPTNTWNLWHEGHIDRMFGRLIENLIAIEGVNPDRVYILGYSAGGDGVYQLAPRMADYLAAAAMMAGHPNDASPLGLRNLPFALQVGGKDTGYNRNKVAAEWGAKLDALQKADPDGYEHFVKIHEDKAHWMNLEDKIALPWMAKHTRNPVPKKVVWKQAGTTHDRFYWLAVPAGEAKPGALVDAVVTGQVVDILTAEKVAKLLIRLDDRLLDLDKPVKVTYHGKVLHEGVVPRTVATQIKTLAGRGDAKLVFDAEVAVDVPSESSK